MKSSAFSTLRERHLSRPRYVWRSHLVIYSMLMTWTVTLMHSLENPQDWMKCLQTFCSNLRKPTQAISNKRLRQVMHCYLGSDASSWLSHIFFGICQHQSLIMNTFWIIGKGVVMKRNCAQRVKLIFKSQNKKRNWLPMYFLDFKIKFMYIIKNSC